MTGNGLSRTERATSMSDSSFVRSSPRSAIAANASNRSTCSVNRCEAYSLACPVVTRKGQSLLCNRSSDWPFLVTTGQAKEYASQRFTEHVDRFEALAAIAERGDDLTKEESDMLVALSVRDNPFPVIDYRSFAARQGHAELEVTG